MKEWCRYGDDVTRALAARAPVVALETTVVTHGLPHPDGVTTALALETIVREAGVTPATIGIIGGGIRVGLTPAELEQLATTPNVVKVNLSNLAAVLSSGQPGSTTVAATMAAEFGHIPGAELVAVGSRSADRAHAFADRYGIPNAYGSYDDFFASDLDAVYLATPHALHTGLALAAIEAGKAVLVEKSFTTSVDDTVTIVEAARAAGVFVMEAMWTRFLPAMVELRRMVDAGDLGEVRTIQRHYDEEPDFRDQVNRYVHDFEAMLRRILAERDGATLGVTLLSSDMGKLYVALAQAIERLRR